MQRERLPGTQAAEGQQQEMTCRTARARMPVTSFPPISHTPPRVLPHPLILSPVILAGSINTIKYSQTSSSFLSHSSSLLQFLKRASRSVCTT